MIKHTGKLMMLKFKQIKDSTNRESKQFTIKDSYSIISAPQKAFGSMLDLEVHMEVCPYKVYTQSNIVKGLAPLAECLEHFDNKEDKRIFINNCNMIDILYYAEFYCIKDCIVLMDGMDQFNKDLGNVFEQQQKKKWIGIESYLSLPSHTI